MITTPQHQASIQRLNPFAFPTNTTTRFWLLIIAVICASLFISDVLYFALPVNRDATRLALSHCDTSAIQQISASPDSFDSFTVAATIGQCMAEQNRQEAFWDLLGVVLLFSVAMLFYWIWPLLRIRRQRLKPFPVGSEVMENMQSFLLSLCQEIGLSCPPLFLISTSSSSIVTFGRWGRYIISLPGRSVVQFQSDLPLFRAVMLHELSHIYNADVNKTYFSLAVGWAFVFVALLPWVLAQVFFPGGFSKLFFEEAGVVIALTAIIYLTLRALLRVREVYADVRASVWDGPEGALKRGVASLQASGISLFRRLLEVHPDRQERIDLLSNTSHLFRLQPGQMFITGLIVSSTLLNIVWLTNLFSVGVGGWYAGVFFAVIIAGTIGVDLWRATFIKELQKKRLPGMLIVTGCFTSGLLVGQFLSLLTLTTGMGYFTDAGYMKQVTPIPWGSWVGFLLTWGALLFFLLLASFRWIMCIAANWLEIASDASSLRRIALITLGLSCILLGIWSGEFNFFRNIVEIIIAQRDTQTGQKLLVGPLYYWYQALRTSSSVPGPLLILVLALFATISWLLINPFILALFLCVWVLPLASWFWRKRRTALADSTWAYLDKPFQIPSSRPVLASPFRLHLVFIASLTGGMAFCLLIPFLFNIFSRHSLDNQMVLAVLFQAVIAGIVAGLAPRSRVAHGLCAAFIAGSIMGLGLLGWNQWYHSLDLTGLATFLWTVNGGALMALPLAAIVAAFAG
jgi:hypothetical protein